MAEGHGFLPPAKYHPSMDIVASAHPPIALGAIVFLGVFGVLARVKVFRFASIRVHLRTSLLWLEPAGV
jgi:hypothetical protein